MALLSDRRKLGVSMRTSKRQKYVVFYSVALASSRVGRDFLLSFVFLSAYKLCIMILVKVSGLI